MYSIGLIYHISSFEVWSLYVFRLSSYNSRFGAILIKDEVDGKGIDHNWMHTYDTYGISMGPQECRYPSF